MSDSYRNEQSTKPKGYQPRSPSQTEDRGYQPLIPPNDGQSVADLTANPPSGDSAISRPTNSQHAGSDSPSSQSLD